VVKNVRNSLEGGWNDGLWRGTITKQWWHKETM